MQAQFVFYWIMGPIFICLDHGKELCSLRANVSFCGFTCHPRTLKQKQLNNMNPPSRFQLVVNIYYINILFPHPVCCSQLPFFLFLFFILYTLLKMRNKCETIIILTCVSFPHRAKSTAISDRYRDYPDEHHTQLGKATISKWEDRTLHCMYTHYGILLFYHPPQALSKQYKFSHKQRGLATEVQNLDGIFFSTQCFISKFSFINARFKRSK